LQIEETLIRPVKPYPSQIAKAHKERT